MIKINHAVASLLSCLGLNESTARKAVTHCWFLLNSPAVQDSQGYYSRLEVGYLLYLKYIPPIRRRVEGHAPIPLTSFCSFLKLQTNPITQLNMGRVPTVDRRNQCNFCSSQTNILSLITQDGENCQPKGNDTPDGGPTFLC